MNSGILAYNMANAESDDKVFDQLLAKAKDQFQKMQEVRQRLLAREDLDPKFRRTVKMDFGIGCYNLGLLARLEDRFDDAIDQLRSAAAAFEEILEDEPADLDNQRRLATCRRMVGVIYTIKGEAAEARQSYELGLKRLDKLVRENPDVLEYQSLQAGILLALYDLEKNESNSAAAQAALERAWRAFGDLAEKDPANAVYQRDLAVALRELAKEKDAAGDGKAASEDLQEAIRILTELVKAYPEQKEFQLRLQETEEVKLLSPPPSN
jgi:tetratricopeptide (TPR) repeat protein